MFNLLSRVSEIIILEDQRNTVMFANNDAKRKEGNRSGTAQTVTNVSSQNTIRDERKSTEIQFNSLSTD